jgi:hypothetical protein
MSLWEVAGPIFADSNGCLCEIVIEPVSERDWNVFLSSIVDTEWPIRFERNGHVSRLPSVVSAVKDEENSVVLRIAPGNLDCNCVFNQIDEIALSFDPAGFRSPERFSELERLMLWLSRLFGKAASVYLNSWREHVLFELDMTATPQ